MRRARPLPSCAPRRGAPLGLAALLLGVARADVGQQYIWTRTVTDHALNDPDWPSPIGDNDVELQYAWTSHTSNVRLDSTVRIEFSENIAEGTGYITVQPPINGLGSSSAAATTIAVPSSDVTVAGKSLYINNSPRQSGVFNEATTYTVSFDAGVVENLAATPDTNSAFSVQFTTGDFTAPTRVDISPADGSTAVDVSSAIVLTFSEAIQANADAVQISVQDFYRRQTPYQISRDCTEATISGNTATISWLGASTFPLLPCQKYQVAYSPKCFTDTTPNKNFAGPLLESEDYSFWTSCITAYSPLPNTFNHLISTDIVLTFAEEVVAGTGDIILEPLGETAQTFDVNDGAKVIVNQALHQVTIVGSASPYLCQGLTMQNCKGKPVDVQIGQGVFARTDVTSARPGYVLPNGLEEQLAGSDYRFTLKPADFTPPVITIVSMYGISESVIRVTVRLDESGTTYCRAYEAATFTPVSQGGSSVPTLTDTNCAACTYAINKGAGPNFVSDSTYDPVRRFAEHEVDVMNLVDKTMYWVYCYSHDIEIPTVNVVTSAQMLATEREVRTLDTTAPTFGTFQCVPKASTEDTITVTLSLNEAGRAYCKVVNRGFISPSPNAVIAEGFFADTADTSDFTIDVDEITTGLGATGMEPLFRKTDYDVYCWAQDGEGYPYHGPNGMAGAVSCPSNSVTTLDLTRPNMRFVMAESISHSQVLITLQVDEGARVWCAAWDVDNDPLITASNYETKIKGRQSTCMDNKGRQCGTFWVYDLDDLEDTSLDLVDTQAQYDSSTEWRYNQDVDIIVYDLVEKKDHPHIYCYAEDDETDGIGDSPNKMMYDDTSNAGPNNVFTIKQGIGSVTTLDESAPSFTQLSMQDPTQYNDRIIVTFSLNEAGTAYCRVTRSDSGETTLRINRILTANYGASVANLGDTAYITIDKLETRASESLYEASQYDVYCWAKDSAQDIQGQPRPNYMLQSYVDTPVGTTGAHALSSPQGGKTSSVWVKDMTPPDLLFVSTEALAQEWIQVTLQLNEPGTVWCQPVLINPDGVYLDRAYVDAVNYKSAIQGHVSVFQEYVHEAFVNVDVEVNKVESRDGATSEYLVKETQYNIYCFAEDDWRLEAQNAASKSINFNYLADNVGMANEITYAAADNFLEQVGVVTTLDLTPPSIAMSGISSGETSITVTLRLDEDGTAWCQAVRSGFNPPTILEILDTNFHSVYNHVNPPVDTEVVILGYDRPKNNDPSYLTPLVLGTDYDVYCYADDDLCFGCRVTNGVSFAHVVGTLYPIRTKDYTLPNMRFVFRESISHDRILITLQVDEGARVWCAAWKNDPGLTASNYITKIKNEAPTCEDNKGRQCGTFWIYDLDDLEDSATDPNDGVETLAEYESTSNWRYNEDVDIILSGLTEEDSYTYIYCYAEDDEATPNQMMYDEIGNQGPNNVYTMHTELGSVETLDESPPSFTKLSILDPSEYNDRIVVTFQLNEAGTAYCRVTRSDSGETTLRINQILSANFGAEVLLPSDIASITVDKLESRDPEWATLYEASQYDVYCWAKDSAVDTQGMPRPNYMTQEYLELPVVDVNAPSGGKTQYVWVKDMTPPTMIYISSEALTDTLIQITLQLNEPGTVWCHPVLPAVTAGFVDNDDITDGSYIEYIKGRGVSFVQDVHVPYINVDVEVNKLDNDDGSGASDLLKETPYNIYCFAEDDWRTEAINAGSHSPNFDPANAATPNMTVGDGNEVTYTAVVDFKDAIGLVTTLDLTPPSITIDGISSGEDSITVTLRLDETGVAWCQAVRHDFDVPTILEILDTNFQTLYVFSPASPTDTVEVTLTGYNRPRNWDNSYLTPLVLGTDYDVYCYANDDLCVGCRVTNAVSFATVQATETFIRTQDYTRPNMRYITAESIAHDQILVTLQVDEGSRVWCAAWDTDPSAGWDSATARTDILAKQADCKDGKGRQCGTFWIYDLDDIEDVPPLLDDGVNTRAEYEATSWKYNRDVDIIMYGLTEKTDYPYIYCFAEDDEATPNKMLYDDAGNFGPSNVYTMHQEINTIATLDESPPSFTRLEIKDPTLQNDRLVVTFKLNEPGTAYCRTTRSDSGETTLRINQILTANYFQEVVDANAVGYITIDKLEFRDTLNLYEATQYDIYCWAKDSAVDTQGLERPNYMIQNYVETSVGADPQNPLGGKTENVWIVDSTPPTIIVVAREALAEDMIQVTLQLNEPGTIWCQVVDKDSSAITTSPGGYYCRDSDVKDSPGDVCHFETFVKGVSSHGTVFSADVHIPYQDYDIDLNKIEKVTTITAGESLVAQYHYNIWCFAEDDWALEATYAAEQSPSMVNPTDPNKIGFLHARSVKDSIGGVITLDQTPPDFMSISGHQFAETVLTMTMTLNEQGTIWCMPVRAGFAEPSVNEILQNNEFNTACGTSACVVTMVGLQSKTTYDIWCYTEDDNTYPQRPNGRKFTGGVGGEVTTLTTLDRTPPILTIVSAESPISSDIRIKVKMEEPGTVWCNSWATGTAYGPVDFDAVKSGNYVAYVGINGASPSSPINTNVEVIVADRVEQTQYDTYCTAEDASTLPSVNKLLDATTVSTQPAIGQIITLDQSPPTFTKLGAKGIDESTIRVTFQCNEDCRAYCRVTRSDSGETTLSINRILKADFKADWSSGDQTIDLNRLEDDSSLSLLERGTLYDTYCWIRDEALQHSCHAKGAGAECETFPKPNYQHQVYVDTAFGGTPPATKLSPSGGKMLHVRTPDTTPPNVIFIEAESTEDTSITVTLQLDEPGTAYCRAYSTTQSATSALFTDLSTGATVYKNTVTNWNNIYKNFEVKITDLTMETKYYVYCVAEDDELMEGATTIDPSPTQNNQAVAILTEASGRFTLDLTPPIITVDSIQSNSESTATVTLSLDEPGTAWCKAVRDRFDPPTINQVIAASFLAVTTTANVQFTVQVENLERDTEYDVYCHARDRGTEVEYGVTPSAGNPGNDVTFTHMLSTKRDIHTMGDSTAPSIVSYSPIHEQTNVDTNPVFEIVFNEDIQAGTGHVTFTHELGSPVVSLDVANANDGSTCASGYAKLYITLTTFVADFRPCPSNFLEANRKWYVSFPAGVFKDDSNAANEVPAFGASQSYYFTTAPR